MTNLNPTPPPQWNPHALHQALAPAIFDASDSPEDPVDTQTKAFDSAIVSAGELAGLELPVREDIVAPFFKVGDLGYVFGSRGSGKSWLTLLLLNAIAQGRDFAGQGVDRPRRVLLVDGEMPLDSVRERQHLLTAENPEGLFFLNHERLHQTASQVLNLAEPAAQQALERVVKEKKIEVLALDNLSCLFYGVRENEADAWEAILPWLLHLRRLQVAVVIVAHAGRNGEMRGTSRREDQAFWILKVTEADTAPNFKGLKFRTQFTKNRNAVNLECPPLEWTLTTASTGRMQVSSRHVTHDCAILSLVNGGLTRASDIAQELGLSTGRVSQIAGTLRSRGLIEMAGREYQLTADGTVRLAADRRTHGEAKRELDVVAVGDPTRNRSV
ncbi:MAG: AAA family ATPase [Verrucomicrobiota bacterium]|nr:AAA family ATPase [Verrucomicrobiota bacterium]